MTESEIETINDHMVTTAGWPDGDVLILRPPVGPMPVEEALRMAAWIVALTDHSDRFDAILRAVNNT